MRRSWIVQSSADRIRTSCYEHWMDMSSGSGFSDSSTSATVSDDLMGLALPCDDACARRIFLVTAGVWCDVPRFNASPLHFCLQKARGQYDEVATSTCSLPVTVLFCITSPSHNAWNSIGLGGFLTVFLHEGEGNLMVILIRIKIAIPKFQDLREQGLRLRHDIPLGEDL